ncbi:MAG: hypothetical protein K0S07_466 [Chlamydiales bacterium]|nr:hypothetical protein [Chlamydiales bacterium]
MNKLKLWNQHPNWESAHSTWEAEKEKAAKEHPLKLLKNDPQMPAMTEETARHLKWKSFLWMVRKDSGAIRRQFLKHPIRYGLAFLKSVFKKKSYRRSGDFFFYGIEGEEAFEQLLKRDDTLFYVGFSYCEKPHECPSKRFTPDCIHDLANPVCRQCVIGKTIHALPEERTHHLLIPTVHYIGEEIFKAVHAHPDKQVIFLITACEMTLEMFGDYGNMVGVQGVGVRLGGRICNTMKAFELSEQGIKPGLTVLAPKTEEKLLSWIKARREATNAEM